MCKTKMCTSYKGENEKYWYEKSFSSTELIAKASLTHDKD